MTLPLHKPPHVKNALAVATTRDERSPATEIDSVHESVSFEDSAVENDSDDDDCLAKTLRQSRSKYGKNLVFAHVNVNSLREKCDYFRNLLCDHLVDVLCITETKLSDDDTIADLHIEGYKFHRKDRSKKSGGIITWVRSDIPHYRDIDLEFRVDDTTLIESMVINLTVKKEQWYLLVTYKNPKVSDLMFVDTLTCFYNDLLTAASVKEIVMLGDININMLQTPNCLSDMFDVYGLTNLVDAPTCFKSTDGTLIDPVVVLNRNRFQKPINIPCGMSDWHNLVGCITKVNVPQSRPQTIHYRSYRKFDNIAFASDISNAPFHVNEIFDDASDKYWFISKLYSNVINEHAPMKKRVLKYNNVPYMNSGLRKQMYRRSNARNKYLRRRTAQNWDKYRQERNKATMMRRQSIKEYFVSRCSAASSPKDFWRCVKPFMSNSTRDQGNIILNENGRIVNSASEVSSLLNDFFANVASNIGPEDAIPCDDPDWLTTVLAKHGNHPSVQAIREANNDSDCFSFSHVTDACVRRKLQQVNPEKATGYDGIPPKLVKCADSNFAAVLANIFNTSFIQKTFPQDLKYAEISPLHKKGNDMLKDNYRPVSILVVLDKIFESIIADQMSEFFNPKFNSMLCAYRKSYGSGHTLTGLLESWKSALDNNKCIGTLLMDLSKAFDCVPHSLLICKLKAYGFTDSACNFIGSYLSDRMQRVKIGHARSSWAHINKGIPQGSCLGPIFFNIFMNDIFYFINKCQLANYADDNTLSACEETFDLVTVALQLDAENAIRWFTSNFMKVNPNKFQVMYMKSIYSHCEMPSFMILDENELKNENHVQLLGITIDSKLTFDRHIDNICYKASRQLNVLRRFQHALRLKEMTMIFNAFILSNFNYCPIVWHFCSTGSIRKMEKIQERALRLIYADNDSPYETLLKKSSQATLHLRRLRVLVLEVFKSIHHLNPDFINDMFQHKSFDYDIRDPNKLVMPSFNTIKYGKNTFSYHGAHMWNFLPKDFKLCMNVSTFKTIIKSWEGPRCQCSMCDFTI